MDNNTENISGPFSGLLSIISSVLAIISLKDVQIMFTIGASLVAMVSGYYAIKYYRKQLKNKP